MLPKRRTVTVAGSLSSPRLLSLPPKTMMGDVAETRSSVFLALRRPPVAVTPCNEVIRSVPPKIASRMNCQDAVGFTLHASAATPET